MAGSCTEGAGRMKLIEKLSDQIEEELCDAEKYIDCAIKLKFERPAMANTYAKISGEEIGHANLLHELVVTLINEYRAKNGDPPEKMQGIYEYLHRKHMEKANEIKIKQALYKG